MRTIVRAVSRTQGAGKPRCSWKRKKQRERAVHRGWESQDTLGGCWWWGYEVVETQLLPLLFQAYLHGDGRGRQTGISRTDLGRMDWLPGYLALSFGFHEQRTEGTMLH